MNEIETHIYKLFRGIPESLRKQEIMQEVTQNLKEKVSDLMEQGQTEQQAVKTALEDFGDIDDLKQELESSAEVMKKKKVGLSLAFSVWGTNLIVAFFLFLNFYYSPQVIWFVYPTFAILWWPMAMFFHWYHIQDNKPVGFSFSVCSFLLIMALIVFINFYYTPAVIWFVYPAFAVIWWPLAMFFHRMRQKSRRENDLDGYNE